MNKKEIKQFLAQMDDIYCEGFQGNVIDWDDCKLALRKLLWEAIPKEIRDYYNWILEEERGPPEFDGRESENQKEKTVLTNNQIKDQG